jgi:type IV pilus assembly protein PilC
MSLLEPIMIVVLGGIVGFIVIALFLPLVQLISKLSG